MAKSRGTKSDYRCFERAAVSCGVRCKTDSCPFFHTEIDVNGARSCLQEFIYLSQKRRADEDVFWVMTECWRQLGNRSRFAFVFLARFWRESETLGAGLPDVST